MKRELITLTAAAAADATRTAADYAALDWAEAAKDRKATAAAASVAATAAAEITTPTEAEITKAVKRAVWTRRLQTIGALISAILMFFLLPGAAIVAVASIVEKDTACAVIFAALFGFVAIGAVEYVKTIREAHASLSDEAIVADIAWELGEDGRRKVNAAANEVEGASKGEK